ncbi:hypothetical protein SAMN04487775_104109 [Treponema bryantii]|uniref:Uncharacterized protein n=1 Tax=Treponema bryantii TaxID=163 RepID=A0A1I3K6W4_9SPIR|nr:hypothetical protein [Treponema bryantii]SFI68229.1 hypothetical protein SAMN04487775_104109 [Treponema bryantii]
MKKEEKKLNVTNEQDNNYLSIEENINYKQLDEHLTNLEKKIDKLLDDKVSTKDIINITKETIKKDDRKRITVSKVIICIFFLFIIAIFADVLFYIFNKSMQIQIINKKIEENILTESEIKELNTKIEEMYSVFKEKKETTGKESSDLSE